MSNVLIDRLRDIVSAGEMSRAGLARAAGLHPNSLRKLGDSDWNPTADTLGKLEKFLASGASGAMASAEQIIDEARNGRMFILSTTRTVRMRATSSSPPRWRRPTRSTSWRSTAAA